MKHDIKHLQNEGCTSAAAILRQTRSQCGSFQSDDIWLVHAWAVLWECCSWLRVRYWALLMMIYLTFFMWLAPWVYHLLYSLFYYPWLYYFSIRLAHIFSPQLQTPACVRRRYSCLTPSHAAPSDTIMPRLDRRPRHEPPSLSFFFFLVSSESPGYHHDSHTEPGQRHTQALESNMNMFGYLRRSFADLHSYNSSRWIVTMALQLSGSLTKKLPELHRSSAAFRKSRFFDG